MANKKNKSHKPNKVTPPDHLIKPLDDSSQKEPARILKIVNRGDGGSQTRRDFLKKLSATAAAIAGGAAVSNMSAGCSSPTDSDYDQVSEREAQYGAIVTIPCGDPLPQGSTCICDCVSTNSRYQACTCDTVCTCNTVRVCTCDSVCSCDTQGGGSYWYPN